jgi:hypothetical protein
MNRDSFLLSRFSGTALFLQARTGLNRERALKSEMFKARH